MFDNIGRKIKTLAKVVTFIGMGGSVLTGFSVYVNIIKENEENFIAGLIIMFLVVGLGCLASWVGSFLLYGYGQLIENTDILVVQKETELRTQKSNNNKDNTISEKEQLYKDVEQI